MKRDLVIIDGFNLIFRVFYAVPPFHTKEGIPVNALFGYTKALMKILSMDAAYVVMTFDSGGATFRSEADATYKAQRDGMPSDLVSQMDLIFQVTDLLGVPRIAVPGFEADDIMGTLVRKHERDMEHIYIVSSDKDLFQFIGDNVSVFDAMKDRVYDREEAIKKFEVEPSQIVDYLALIWDTSDNIPWVKWIGPKGAVKLLQEYTTLDNILTNIDKLSPKMQAMIGDGASAKHSQFLATIRTDVPYDINVIDLARQTNALQYTPELVDFFRKYEFKSLLPAMDQWEHTVFHLKNPAIIATDERINRILQRIDADEPYSLSTDGYPELTALAIAFSPEEVYSIDLVSSCAPAFAQSLIDHPHQLTTYNWKESIRKMGWWLGNENL